jgi:hypothetical protein
MEVVEGISCQCQMNLLQNARHNKDGHYSAIHLWTKKVKCLTLLGKQ